MWGFNFRWAHWQFIYRINITLYLFSLFEKLKSSIIRLTLLLCRRFTLISYIVNNTHRFCKVILFFICDINIITCFFTVLIIHRDRPILYLSNGLTLCMWNILFALFYAYSLLLINSRHNWCWHSSHVITLVVSEMLSNSLPIICIASPSVICLLFVVFEGPHLWALRVCNYQCRKLYACLIWLLSHDRG